MFEFKNIRELINDIWNFFVPPFANMLTSFVVIDYATAGGLWEIAVTYIQKLSYEEELDQFKKLLHLLDLDSLFTILIIFVLALIIFVFDRVFHIVNSLFPINVSYSMDEHITSEVYDLWFYYPNLTRPHEIFGIIDSVLSKAEANSLITNKDVKYWQEANRKVSFFENLARFLIVFIVVLSLMKLLVYKPIALSTGRSFVVLISMSVVLIDLRENK